MYKLNFLDDDCDIEGFPIDSEFPENFKKEEFECNCGCGKNNVDQDLINLLNRSRYLANTPFVINSGSRCVSHNKKVGGSKTSSHLSGLAVDIKCKDSQIRFKIIRSLLMVGFSRILIYKNFIHVDIDNNKPQKLISLM